MKEFARAGGRPHSDGPDLSEVVARVAGGDKEAFATLYDSIAGPVFGLVLKVLRDPSQSEEVTQEIMVEVWRTATRFRPEQGSVMTWVMTMAHRRAVDRVRSEQAAIGPASGRTMAAISSATASAAYAASTPPSPASTRRCHEAPEVVTPPLRGRAATGLVVHSGECPTSRFGRWRSCPGLSYPSTSNAVSTAVRVAPETPGLSLRTRLTVASLTPA